MVLISRKREKMDIMELTKAEEQIMQILWQEKKAFVKDIIEQLDEPKPAYNTVSTIVRILEKKQFVGYESFGKTYQYYPLVQKEDYTRKSLRKMMDGYFNKSYKNLVSFFSKDENMTIKEMENIRRMMDEKIEALKNKKS
jgi:predicted transcriptional regulator